MHPFRVVGVVSQKSRASIRGFRKSNSYFRFRYATSFPDCLISKNMGGKVLQNQWNKKFNGIAEVIPRLLEDLLLTDMSSIQLTYVKPRLIVKSYFSFTPCRISRYVHTYLPYYHEITNMYICYGKVSLILVWLSIFLFRQTFCCIKVTWLL